MQFVQDNLLLFAVLFVSGALLLWPLAQRRLSPMKEAGTLAVTHLLNTRDAVLLDLREPKEIEGGKLPNAVHIPLSQLGTRGTELSKFASRPVVAYCARGNRSRSAGGALQKLGFAEIYNLNGGFQAWKDAGMPVEK